MAFPDSAGVWADGVPVAPDEAGRMLRGWLATADFVTVVVVDGDAVPHTVTLTETFVQDLGSLAGPSAR